MILESPISRAQIDEISRQGVARSLTIPSAGPIATLDRDFVPSYRQGELTNWHVYGLVEKYDGPEADYRAAHEMPPDDYSECYGNLLTTAGLNRMTSLIIGAGGTAYNNANTRIGVGDTNTAAVIADADLKAAANAANRQFEVMAATYPLQANGVITARSVFATTEANFAWAEWVIDNGTAVSITVVTPVLNRKVAALGTKTSASAWTFTVTITIT